jgi:hypothetical protein
MWESFKALVEQYSNVDRDGLHIHAGLLLYVGVTAILRQPRESRIPWLVVFVVEFMNEAADMRAATAQGPLESAMDAINTLFWPTLLMIVGRYTRWIPWTYARAEAAPLPQTSSAEVEPRSATLNEDAAILKGNAQEERI